MFFCPGRLPGNKNHKKPAFSRKGMLVDLMHSDDIALISLYFFQPD